MAKYNYKFWRKGQLDCSVIGAVTHITALCDPLYSQPAQRLVDLLKVLVEVCPQEGVRPFPLMQLIMLRIVCHTHSSLF